MCSVSSRRRRSRNGANFRGSGVGGRGIERDMGFIVQPYEVWNTAGRDASCIPFPFTWTSDRSVKDVMAPPSTPRAAPGRDRHSSTTFTVSSGKAIATEFPSFPSLCHLRSHAIAIAVTCLTRAGGRADRRAHGARRATARHRSSSAREPPGSRPARGRALCFPNDTGRPPYGQGDRPSPGGVPAASHRAARA